MNTPIPIPTENLSNESPRSLDGFTLLPAYWRRKEHKRLTWLIAASAALGMASQLAAFTVVNDINSGKPAVEKLVIFEKGKGADQVMLSDPSKNSLISINADGAIEIVITGNKEIKPQLAWKPSATLPATFNASDYRFLIVTCAMLGDVFQTFGTKVSAVARGNLWFGMTLFDNKGQRVGSFNFADITEDKKTPATMVTLQIPMTLMTKGTKGDPTAIGSIGFPWSATHDHMNRDLHFIIEKIALAE